MTLLIQERIAAFLLGRLNGIRTMAGYRFNAQAEAVETTTNTPAGEVYLLLSVGDPTPSDDHPINFDDYEDEFTVTYDRFVSESDTNRTMKSLQAEVYGEVMRSVMTDETCGGLAITVKNWGHSTEPNGGSGKVSGDVTFTVHYRTLESNAFASAFES